MNYAMSNGGEVPGAPYNNTFSPKQGEEEIKIDEKSLPENPSEEYGAQEGVPGRINFTPEKRPMQQL